MAACLDARGQPGGVASTLTPGFEPQALDDDNPYETTAEGIVWHHRTRDGVVSLPLSNFAAEIVADVSVDDGAGRRRDFEVRARTAESEVTLTVPAARFSSLDWVSEELGARAIVYPGYGRREHLRCAVQVLSPNVRKRTVYAHTGWREVGGEWLYLHAGGALGKDGPVAGVEVLLPAVLDRFRLATGGATAPGSAAECIRESLRFLDAAPRRITVPLLAAVYRAALGGADFALHLSGESGAGKTELAALCQQHYGAEMVARHLPGSWSSTANALERIAFAAKDALLVVDDFCPQGAGTSAPALYSAADRLLRAQGNRSGRHRLGGEGMLRLAAPPRGLILSTGEELPKGLSLRARIVAVEVTLGDVDWSAVTACQRVASEGAYAQALSAFVRWVAGSRAAVLDNLRRRTESLRTEGFGRGRGHKRSLGNLASLRAAWEVVVSFATECGAAGAGEAEALAAEASAVFDALAKEQAEVQLAEDPARKFLETLAGALAAGRAHVASVHGGPPADPGLWGWRPAEASGSSAPVWEPQGDAIGWVDAEAGSVFLLPQGAYALAEKLAGEAGGALRVAPKTLFCRLRDRGALRRSDPGHVTKRLKVDGRIVRVLDLDPAPFVSLS